jgi:cytochrome b involved in lipid metabolism
MNRILKLSIQILIVNFILLWLILVFLGFKMKNGKTSPKVVGLGESGLQTSNQINNVTATPSPTAFLPSLEISPSPTTPLPVSELASHNTPSDCWVMISGKIYDITGYFGQHPGGDAIMAKYCGKDATNAYNTKEKNPAKPHSAKADFLLNQFLAK